MLEISIVWLQLSGAWGLTYSESWRHVDDVDVQGLLMFPILLWKLASNMTSQKSFIWCFARNEYWYTGMSFFSLQENSFLDVESKEVCGFEKDMKLEAIDPKHPSFICVCTIVRVKGTRLRLHFDGWSESYDFWTSADSPFLFHIGWCEKNGQKLHPPRSKRKTRTCSFWSLLCSKIQD